MIRGPLDADGARKNTQADRLKNHLHFAAILSLALRYLSRELSTKLSTSYPQETHRSPRVVSANPEPNLY